MSEPPGPVAAPKRQRRFWLNVGEVVGVLALVITGVNAWQGWREHKAQEQHTAAAERAQSAFVLIGQAKAGGRIVALDALKREQAIQSQRYIFPTSVLDHPMEISAAGAQIDAAWIASGLDRALDKAHAKGQGEALLPVGIVTTYVEDGETRTDRSLYRVGYAWRSRLLLGRQITLQGISLGRRGVTGNLQALVDQRWAATGGSADQ